MASSFTVGDFRASGTPEPRSPKKTKAAATVDRVAEESAEVESAPTKTPQELYKERLAEAGLTEAEANDIFDDVISKGYYQEAVKIRGRRLVLRTRTYDDHARTIGAVEVQGPRFQATQEDIQARNNLAASLVEWNGVTYKNDKDPDKEFQAAMEAVRRLPTPIYYLLINALVKFDAKMFIVFSDGAAESF